MRHGRGYANKFDKKESKMKNKEKFKEEYKKLCNEYGLVVGTDLAGDFVVKELNECKKNTGNKYLNYYFKED